MHQLPHTCSTERRRAARLRPYFDHAAGCVHTVQCRCRGPAQDRDAIDVIQRNVIESRWPLPPDVDTR